MSMHTWETIGLLWVILLYTPYTATATRIFCQAPPVFPGDPANLTCYFPEDLRHSRTSFGVFRRDSDVSRSEMVLACNWDGGQPVCDDKKGFHLVSHVSYEVTVGIPSHKPEIFCCETIPRKRNITASVCNFTLNASATPSSTTVPPSSTEAPKTTEEWGDSDGQLPVAIQVAVSVGIVIADLLVIGIVLLWMRRRSGPEEDSNRVSTPASDHAAYRDRRMSDSSVWFRKIKAVLHRGYTSGNAAPRDEPMETRLPTSEDNVNSQSQPACDEEAAQLLTGEEISTIRSTDNSLAADPKA